VVAEERHELIGGLNSQRSHVEVDGAVRVETRPSEKGGIDRCTPLECECANVRQDELGITENQIRTFDDQAQVF
jgi:hypothetical protein